MKQYDNALTLSELNSIVRQVIETAMSRDYWVAAELAEARESGGHLYMELVEKDDRGNTPVARARAMCWRTTWAMLAPAFRRAAGTTLRAGMKVLLRVTARFHEAYGFSWIVTDIDPTFTLGDMARRRQEIVARLKADGVFDMNRSRSLPLFAQSIAVVSSAGAAGYGDFCRQLEDNPHGYRFRIELFAALMQGEGVEASVMAALDRIARRSGEFDCVVIIRGGGASADLSGFDTLKLAEKVARFELPVITGIGHERDESVVDMVAHTKVKTPTAAAALLVERLDAVAERIDRMRQRLRNYALLRLQGEQMRLARAAGRLPDITALACGRMRARLDMLGVRLEAAAGKAVDMRRRQIDAMQDRLAFGAGNFLAGQRHRLQLLSQRAAAVDPALLLKRGYSITLADGRVVRSSSQVAKGDIVETITENGTIKSIVI